MLVYIHTYPPPTALILAGELYGNRTVFRTPFRLGFFSFLAMGTIFFFPFFLFCVCECLTVVPVVSVVSLFVLDRSVPEFFGFRRPCAGVRRKERNGLSKSRTSWSLAGPVRMEERGGVQALSFWRVRTLIRYLT